MLIEDRLEAIDQDQVMIRSHDAKLPADPPPGPAGLADHLSRKFTAPVGILDTRRWIWDAVAGATTAAFPNVDGKLRDLATSAALRSGKVALWSVRCPRSLNWLVMALPSSDGTEWVAFAGFLRPPHHECPDRDEVGSGVGSDADEATAWGPVCPEPALRAWGQQVVDRLESKSGTRILPIEPAPVAESESEHLVIGRLIRRMRISDSPTRFQSLATNVLRTSLGMAAVAWVPNEPREPVVTSGEIEGLPSSALRTAISMNPRDSAVVVDRPDADQRSILFGVRNYVSVAAGAAGWLVAVNSLQDRPIGTADVERMQYVASLIATQSSNSRSYSELKELLFGIIRALTAAVDAKDRYTCGHSERVARIAVRLAEELGMAPQARSDLYLAGLLHDIGKIGVSDKVLNKPGPLTPEEFRVIQSHVETGVIILRDLKKLSHILPAVRHHHESVDGSGYPDQLSGEQIPMEARILAVADSFDAMSSDRLYRKRLSTKQIDDIFRKGRGVQWDAKVVDAMFASRRDLEKIRQKGLGESLIGAVDVTLGRG